ncbi:precorrin-6y C5,15-methyltransferase (decarboxylating) subunit CbiE [Mesorhizobium xinjiangense]|uniref:precorrin-6y C5,15-methyltransferase (decarboxylating) subunit CbiE n=1 Tax=Mesorhizobium xinjiangense TaxID=2678685 RepID=UPI0012ED70F2|nr:precorrin-6y C5,15-methyltransferase (decarboxylating) subunit CbiE [Mesorhizobium xinjiangense]
MSSNDLTQPVSTGKWLAIVGIGEDGLAGLGETARQRIAEAAHIFGGRRHIELAREAIRGTPHAWPSPFDTEMTAVRALRGKPVCVLASGDPFCYGVGVTLAKFIPMDEMEAFPAPSAFSLAAARLGWALQDTATISLHGHSVARLRPLLHKGSRIMALTSGAEGPGEIAGLLNACGFGASRMAVLENLGGERERIAWHVAGRFEPEATDPLNVVAIEVEAGEDARALPLATGLDDELFDHDGQITKREIRTLSLSALAPRPGRLLWDVGAGSGSVAIEWMLRHPSMRAVAIEADHARAERIRFNAEQLGVPDLTVVEGMAPQALAGQAPPDAVFLGGGGSRPGVIETIIDALKPGGRLVANAVTLEMEAVLLKQHADCGGEMTRLSVARAAPIGGLNGWQPARPITQWVWQKP